MSQPSPPGFGLPDLADQVKLDTENGFLIYLKFSVLLNGPSQVSMHASLRPTPLVSYCPFSVSKRQLLLPPLKEPLFLLWLLLLTDLRHSRLSSPLLCPQPVTEPPPGLCLK